MERRDRHDDAIRADPFQFREAPCFIRNVLKHFGRYDDLETACGDRQVLRIPADEPHTAIQRRLTRRLQELRAIEVQSHEHSELKAAVRDHGGQIALATSQIQYRVSVVRSERLDDCAISPSTRFLKEEIRVRGFGPVHVTALDASRFVCVSTKTQFLGREWSWSI